MPVVRLAMSVAPHPLPRHELVRALQEALNAARR